MTKISQFLESPFSLRHKINQKKGDKKEGTELYPRRRVVICQRLSCDMSGEDVETRLLAACETALARGLSPMEIRRTLLLTSTPSSSSSSITHRSLVLVIMAGLLPLLLLLLSSSLLLPDFTSSRCLLPSHPLLMEMVRPIQDNCSFCSVHNGLLELREPPSKSWFEGVAYKKIPIIVRGSGSRVSPPLDLPSLRRILESEPDFWEDGDECQFLPFRSPFTSLRGALESIGNASSAATPTSWYIGWSNCHPGIQRKLRALVPRPGFLPEGGDSSGSAIDWIFLGWPGPGASLHIDYVRRPSWQLQLSGVKRWELRPPPECEEGCGPSLHFTTHPGDLLFLETNLWYHSTRVEGKDISISLGSEYD